jgi:hypothetical protein
MATLRGVSMDDLCKIILTLRNPDNYAWPAKDFAEGLAEKGIEVGPGQLGAALTLLIRRGILDITLYETAHCGVYFKKMKV